MKNDVVLALEIVEDVALELASLGYGDLAERLDNAVTIARVADTADMCGFDLVGGM